jgi:hypothetical protein
MIEARVSPAAHYSAHERCWSVLASVLTLLVLALGLHDFWRQYFPGQEDASLIVEAMKFDATYWLKIGYFEWFNVHPGEQPVVDYEIRPLTHLLTWALYQVAADHWWVYPAFNALIASLFVGMMVNFVLSYRRHWSISAAALILAVPLNPANSVEFLLDHSFYQVLLCSALFILMYQQWRAQRYMLSACLCVLGVVLKESAWFYPGVFVLLLMVDSLNSRKWPLRRQWIGCGIAVGVSAMLFILMHPGKLLSSDVAVFSIGMYDEGLMQTLWEGLCLLPHFIQVDQGWIFSLLCVLTMMWVAWGLAEARYALCLVIPALIAGWLFHEELRWTHELTLAWVVFLLTLRGPWLIVLGLLTGLGWSLSSVPRLEREWVETRAYGFYAEAYRKPFRTALGVSQAADSLGIRTLLVANDPIRMNGDYYSILAGNTLNWVTLNSIDYPYDNRYPDESPLWKGPLLLMSKAGDMGFMGFQGKRDGWMATKHYGEDVRVLQHFSGHEQIEYPKGQLRFHRKGHASLIEHVGPLPQGVAYAYFWRDSKDAWLFYRDEQNAPAVRLVSPYAKSVGGQYWVDVPLHGCDQGQVEWLASDSDSFKLSGCYLQGRLQPGQYLSVQLKQGKQTIWAYVMRAPDHRVILEDTQEFHHE